MECCLNFLGIFLNIEKNKILRFFFLIFHVFFVFHAISNIKIGGGGGGGGVGCVDFFLEKQLILSHFTYWLNGRWFLQIVERDSWNLYPLSSIPLFWFCISNVGGGGGV